MNMKRLPAAKGPKAQKHYTVEQLEKYFGLGRFNTFCSFMETVRPGASTEPTFPAEDVMKFVYHKAILD
jgi:hypothetical protein